MNRIDIMDRLLDRIKSCNKDLIWAKSIKKNPIYIENFRSRLDELILFYVHIISREISFMDACKELGIKYEDVNTEFKPKANKVKEVKERGGTHE